MPSTSDLYAAGLLTHLPSDLHAVAWQVLNTSTYFVLWVLTLWWLQQGLRTARALTVSPRTLAAKYWPALVSALALATIVFVSVPPKFRTLSDETNLISVSQSMFERRTVELTTEGNFYDLNFHPLSHEIPTRPFLFPFALSLLHTLTGYRHTNAFALNFLVLTALLSLVYAATRRVARPLAAIAAQVTVVSFPVVTFCATSAGFDLFATLFWALMLAALLVFLMRPRSESFGLLWTTLLLLAHTRYEYILFPPLVLALVALLAAPLPRKTIARFFTLSSFALTALAVLPLLLQRALTTVKVEDIPPGATAVSVFNILPNLKHAFLDSVLTRLALPSATLIWVPAAIALIYLGARTLRRHSLSWLALRQSCQSRPIYLLFAIAAATIAARTLTLLLYGMVDCHLFTHPSTQRYFAYLAFLSAFALGLLHSTHPRGFTARRFFAFSAFAFFVHHPIVVDGRYMNWLYLNRTTEYEQAFLARLPAASPGSSNDKRVLLITERPGQFTAQGYGAIFFSRANRDPARILRDLREHLFLGIYVFQRVRYSDGKPHPDDALNAAFSLRALEEMAISKEEFLRVSQVVPGA